MGLDMYLDKEIYVGAEYEHRKVTGTIDVKQDGKPIKVDFAKVASIIERAGYWRKANAIHKWFVDHVQNGEDNCQRSYVDFAQLKELRDLCIRAIETKDASLLPPQSGFFFGSTEVDEWYWKDLEHTAKLIGSLDPEADYYYHASW